LRRGEALNLEWHNIDWVHNRLRVIGRDDWQTKDRQARVVPVCPELSSLLLDAFEQADEKQGRVIPPGVVVVKNISRDFDALCRRAGVVRYPKPLHTLRKSCITDWASRHPGHVVKQWAGHSDMDTTEQYYLQVSEAEYEQAAATPMSAVVAKKLAKNHPEQGNEPRKDNRRQSITNGD
jgi:integrase